MKRGPQQFYADDLKDWNVSTAVQHPIAGEVWVAARPECATWETTIFHRLRLAWIVFTGKADILRWRQQ